ncbi:BldC family transcriptional regulator [Tsukamurella sp. 8F]|nr:MULTISPECIES: BldC family transcriptional regulator [unclassified Tsukamurella]MDF0531659.1 BldC family transcriptional regulator [Tsukamurella sp. 8J]MDF0588773.1 BldC family transcriptional regulator [Tsukamurella sp. 8F]
MTPGQVAALFNVNPKTVTRWAGAGLLGAVRTPGGHRRFRASEVLALLNQNSTTATR